MSLTVEAVYEHGVLKPTVPLPLKEQERVQITIETVKSPLLAAYGIMGWKGTPEELERFAEDPELDYPPPPEEP